MLSLVSDTDFYVKSVGSIHIQDKLGDELVHLLFI